MKEMAASKYIQTAKYLSLYWILPILVLLLWKGAALLGIIHNYTLPSPDKVIQTAVTLTADGTLAGNIIISILRVLEGFFLALAAALAVGVAAGLSGKFEIITDFILQVLKPIPPIAWIPLAILWFGIGEASKIYIIFIGAFFPVFLNTLDGIKNIDRKYIELARVYEVSKKRVIKQVVLPGALPFIMTGTRLGLGSAWICVVASEMIAATRGVGYMLMDGRDLARPDMVILGMIIIGIVGKFMDDILKKLSTVMIKWN
ncbi:ABC transporter permease [Pectinatus haikarae]|uniref:Sulfonate transport system permease protein n=1 Tax=Pectinatus haikarae TaxID=349096 RepID=A0ABT9YAD1_9FIRM|nr:ABC transporter permease [Pectinatus haikarae]MDQ0204496.1 sulfonate transport system permease protein [Pectinatus haikarae]